MTTKRPWTEGELLDTLGRRNRKLANRSCKQCGNEFRPLRSSSKYCSLPCAAVNRGKTQVRRKEVWWVCNRGYIVGRVTVDGKTRRVRQHRYIMEQHLGRTIPSDMDVHHINGNKQDNRIENLMVLPKSEHARISNKGRVVKKGHKLNLTDKERRRRSDWMKQVHAARAARAALRAANPDAFESEGE